MDCQAARELLDRAASGADHLPPAVREAQAHLEQCSACQELFESRERFEGRLAATVRDVDVPAHLRDRLLLAVARETRPVSIGPPASGKSSRRLLVRIAAGVCTLAVAVGVWQFIESRRPRQFDLAQLQAVAARLLQQAGGNIDLSLLPKFDGAFSLPAVKEWREWARTVELHGLEIDGRGHDDAVATIVPIGRDPSAVCIYVIVPAARLSDASVLASQATVSYAPVAHAAWKSGDFVFVCITTQNHLDDLMRFAPGGSAA